MEDEVEWSKAKAKPLNGFEDARRQPLALLLGLVVGLGCAWVLGAIAPPLAPLLPLLVGGPLLLFPRTQAVALGVLAAACGAAVFLVTGFVLLWIL